VAKRGALFMIDLKHFVHDRATTSSTSRPTRSRSRTPPRRSSSWSPSSASSTATTSSTRQRTTQFCLVNDAVYIARQGRRGKDAKWTAVGAQFQHPVRVQDAVHHEDIKFDDYCETKQVTKGAMYMDFEARTTQAGVRSFCLLLTPKLEERLRREGWNVKELQALGRRGTRLGPTCRSTVKYSQGPASAVRDAHVSWSHRPGC
jgi:hypothetical protein